MIKVIKKGLYTSIQDCGRHGFRKYGVPVAGAMDQTSALVANAILGNDFNTAVMEITMQGPKLEFTVPASIAITGADLSPALNGESLTMNTALSVQPNDILSFGQRKNGARSYLAVSGGFQTEEVLNSMSFYDGVTKHAVLSAGDELPIGTQSSSPKDSIERRTDIHQTELKVFKGPEFDQLNDDQQKALTNTTFTVGMNNRMGYQLKELIDNRLESILSSAVLPGTVQLTPSGKLIVLMRDCQTTGGYPRVLQLSANAVDVLSQKVLRDQVTFRLLE